MRKTLKRIGSALLSLAVSLQIFAGTTGGLSLTTFAASGTVIGPYTITGGMRNIDYKLEDDIFKVLKDTPLTIANTNIATASTVPIEIPSNVNANITLAGVNVAPASNAALYIADNSEGNVTITLADDTTNTLVGASGYAGLQKNGDYISEDKGKLTIKGEAAGNGILKATGGSHGAGIGSNTNFNCANIIIDGGDIIAQGGDGGAGIGGGSGVTSGASGANGDNGSNGVDGADDAIRDGGTGGQGGTGGIGDNGNQGGTGGNGSYITINSGKVVAKGGAEAAGIGGGKGGTGGQGGTGGNGGNGGNGGDCGYDSDGGTGGKGGQGGNGGTGGQGGTGGNGSYITINGGQVTATGGDHAAGIGGGTGGQGGIGGTSGNGGIGGTGGYSDEGIGGQGGQGGQGGIGGNGGIGGKGGNGSYINIMNGIIQIKGGAEAAGIGGGKGGQGGQGGTGGQGGNGGDTGNGGNGETGGGQGGTGGKGGNGNQGGTGGMADHIIIRGGEITITATKLSSGIGGGQGGADSQGGTGGQGGKGGGGNSALPGDGGNGGNGGDCGYGGNGGTASRVSILGGTLNIIKTNNSTGIGGGTGGHGILTWGGEGGMGGKGGYSNNGIGFFGSTGGIGSKGNGSGGGNGGDASVITIADANIVISENISTGIGGGQGGITSNRSSVNRSAGNGGSVRNVVITNSTLNITSKAGAGIGGGQGGTNKGVAANHSGSGGNANTIKIIESTVIVTSEAGGAGIGGGAGGTNNMTNGGTCDTINITDGSIVTAMTETPGAPGIGGKTCTNVLIEDSSVKATGSYLGSYVGAAIGTNATSSVDGIPTIPVNRDAESLYLAVIENPNNTPIIIDGEEFPVTKHANDDLNVYAYLTDAFHTVTASDVSKAYNPRTGQILPLPTVTAPTPVSNLVYNTNEQTLIEAGETSNGTMMYTLDKAGPWSTALPKATNADTYTVWYKSQGDNVTIASTNPESIEVTIAKAPWVFSQDQLDNISATSVTYEQTLADSVISGSDTYAGTYAWKEPDTMPVVADSNRTGFTVVFTPTDTNYDAAETTCTLVVNKKAFVFTQSDINSMAASDLTYGQTLSESSITGTTPVDGSFRFVDGTTVPIVNGTNNFAVEFVPIDTDNYEISSVGDLHVTVNKADPIITAEQLAAMTVSEITYGQTLADSTITATPTTPGTFRWTDQTIAPIVADSLNTEYEILFTPTDTDNYKTRTIYKTVKVNKAPIVLSDAIKQSVTATSIVYEQTLADSVLDGDVPQAGHYEWVDNTIAPSVADSNVIAYDVIFVPDDKNYANAELTCMLTVSKKVFTFTQSDIDNMSASDLTYGQTLSESSITGTTPVDGSFRFVDGATVPTVLGTNNFAVEFVPRDTDNYEISAVGDLHVTVNKADPIITPDQLAAITTTPLTYGETLADSTIVARSTTPGRFAWSDDTIAPTVFDSSTTLYEIIFTPNDADNYNTKTLSQTVVVRQAEPVVPDDIATSISASRIKLGQKLNDSTISYTGSGTLTGSLSWTNPETQPAIADSDTIEYAVTYTPVDNVNYKTLSYTAKVHVDKGTAPSSLQDFSTTISTGTGEGGSGAGVGTGTTNADGSITLDLSTILDLPGVSGVVSGVVDPNGVFDGTPTITDGTKLTYKTNPVGPDVTGTIKVVISSRDYEDFEIEIAVKSTNCPHNNVTNNVGRRAATCSEEGYTGDTVCDDCHCTVAYGWTVAVTSHNRITKGRIDATCTSEGYSGDVYCKDCGTFITRGEVTEKLSHTEGEPVVDVAATYTSEGKRSYYCKDCNAFIRSEVIPKISLDGHEHVWTSQYHCDEHDHWQECLECHNLSDKEAHHFDDGDYITATCTTAGEVRYVCTVCGITITKTEVPGHRPVWRYDENGNKHFKQCKLCGEVFESQDHNYGEWVEMIAPTDAELGTYTHTCSQCGYIETVRLATNPETASDIGGSQTGSGQNGSQTGGSQTGSNAGKGENPDTGIEFDVIKFVALALVAGATILLQRKCKI